MNACFSYPMGATLESLSNADINLARKTHTAFQNTLTQNILKYLAIFSCSANLHRKIYFSMPKQIFSIFFLIITLVTPTTAFAQSDDTINRIILNGGDELFWGNGWDQAPKILGRQVADGTTVDSSIGQGVPTTGSSIGQGGPTTGSSIGEGGPTTGEASPRDGGFRLFDDTLANLWGGRDITATPLALDLWRFARMSTFIPFILLAIFTTVTFIISCLYIFSGLFGGYLISHGGQNYQPNFFSANKAGPPEWWKVLSRAYSRIGEEHVKINRRVNIMFGLSIGSISVSLGASILLFDSLMRGGQTNSFLLFGFISPIILFQTISLFFIRTSLKLQGGLDITRKELNSIQSLMASSSASSENNEALSKVFAAHRESKLEEGAGNVKRDSEATKESPNVDPRVVAAAINVASKAGF